MRKQAFGIPPSVANPAKSLVHSLFKPKSLAIGAGALGAGAVGYGHLHNYNTYGAGNTNPFDRFKQNAGEYNEAVHAPNVQADQAFRAGDFDRAVGFLNEAQSPSAGRSPFALGGWNPFANQGAGYHTQQMQAAQEEAGQNYQHLSGAPDVQQAARRLGVLNEIMSNGDAMTRLMPAQRRMLTEQRQLLMQQAQNPGQPNQAAQAYGQQMQHAGMQIPQPQAAPSPPGAPDWWAAAQQAYGPSADPRQTLQAIARQERMPTIPPPGTLVNPMTR